MSREDRRVEAVSNSEPVAPDANMTLEVNLRLSLDEVAELEAGLLAINGRREPSQAQLRQLARKIYDARRLRDRLLDDSFFGEPAWDMLLALYHLPALGKVLTVSSLCFCSGVPQTTALRCQTRLFEEGLIDRALCQRDGRKKFVRLTDQGREMLDRYLTRLFQCEKTRVPVLRSNAD